jgi:hypothetical protein
VFFGVNRWPQKVQSLSAASRRNTASSCGQSTYRVLLSITFTRGALKCESQWERVAIVARLGIRVQCSLVHRPPAVSSFSTAWDGPPTSSEAVHACLQFSLILIRDSVKTELKSACEHASFDATEASVNDEKRDSQWQGLAPMLISESAAVQQSRN